VTTWSLPGESTEIQHTPCRNRVGEGDTSPPPYLIELLQVLLPQALCALLTEHEMAGQDSAWTAAK
jgi:hypothetical protein